MSHGTVDQPRGKARRVPKVPETSLTVVAAAGAQVVVEPDYGAVMTLLRTAPDPADRISHVDGLGDAVSDVWKQLEAQSEQAVSSAQWQLADATFVSLRDLSAAFVEYLAPLLDTVSVDLDDPDRESIEELQVLFQVVATWANARAESARGMAQLWQGDPKAAGMAFKKAKDAFDTVIGTLRAIPADEDLEEFAATLLPLVQVQRGVQDYQVMLADGNAAMVRGKYDEAMGHLVDAQAAIKRSLNQFPEELAESRSGLEADLESTAGLYEFCAFSYAYGTGDFDAATAAATRMVERTANARQSIELFALNSWLQAMSQVQSGVFEGYLRVAKAEEAIAKGQWQSARDHVDAARDVWVETAIEAVGSGLAPGRSLADSIQRLTSTVLPGLRRRINREEELGNVISRLEAELREARRVYDMGDTTFIGSISESNVNIKSKLDNVQQNIKSAGMDETLKRDLEQLVKQLKTELEQVPSEQAQDAETVAEFTDELVTKATKGQPNRRSVEISAEGLKEAAKNIAGVVPIVTQIVATILRSFA